MPSPISANRLWKFLHLLARFILRPLFCTMEVDGWGNVPRTGGCLMACNHTMGPDYVLIGYAASRQVYYMAKTEAFTIHPWLSKFLYAAGVFPIKRGGSDSGALDRAVHLLEEGHAVGMFPEGTRSRTGVLGTGKSGTARIAMRANVPVVPAISINGNKVLSRFKQWSRPHVVVRFGPPLTLEGDPNDPTVIRENTYKIMVAMASLLPPEQRGPYAEDVQALLSGEGE